MLASVVLLAEAGAGAGAGADGIGAGRLRANKPKAKVVSQMTIHYIRLVPR
jgi:hypothetical protein